MSNEYLEPPPSKTSVFDAQWIRWIYNLYEYVTAMTNTDPYMTHAVAVIKSTYGDTVSVEKKSKDLLKFGRVNLSAASTRRTVEVQPNTTQNDETYATGNTINRIVSSSTADIAANNSSDCMIEGHTVDGSGNYIFSVQSVVLNGRTPITLTTPLARVTRWYNDDSAETVGVITVYESAVTTITAGAPTAGYTGVHLTARAGKQNSEKCSTTISSTDYAIVTGVYANVLSKNGETVEFTFEVREKGKVFREAFKFNASDVSESFRMITPYRVIPKNADVRIRALNDATTNIVAGAGFFSVLAEVV